MLKTLIKKEILEAIFSHRFLIATLLCLVLIPLGMYVNLKEYEQRLADYQELVRLYQKHAEGNIHAYFQAEGYRPPSILSIFSMGLEYFLPNKIVTSREGYVRTINESGINNPQSLLFGKVDLLFNVSFVISLLALIFTFSTITGEKEEATLRLVMSNPVPRWQILLAKIVGNYLVLLIPFLLSILIALIVLSTSGIVPVFSVGILLPLFVILLITLLFILVMFNLGIFVSTLTHRSITSIVTLLFVWTVLVLSLPKISPMVAEIAYPVKSQQVLNLQKLFIRENFEKELNRKRQELYDKILADLGLDTRGIIFPGETEAGRNAQAKFDEAQKPLEEEYNRRIQEEIRKLVQDYDNKLKTQQAIAMNLSRLSPVSCYAYIVSEVSATGLMEMNNFLNFAQRFQEQVKESIYDKFITRYFGGTSGFSGTMVNQVEGFDPSKASVPQLVYEHTNIVEALKAEWVDILLLFLFNVMFFAVSYVSFLRYDVR